MGSGAGACEFCLRGRPRLCAQTQNVMGTFAEQFAVYVPGLVVLPDSIPDTEAPLACGGLTAYGAVKKVLKHGVLPGRPVAVIGAAGGLGHYVVQLLTGFGFRVVGVDIGEARLDFVRSLGAELPLDPDSARRGGAARARRRRRRARRLGSARRLPPRSATPAQGRPVRRRRPAADERGCILDRRVPPVRDRARRSSSPWSGTCRTCRELVDLAARGKIGRTSTAPARCPTSTRSSRSSRPASSSDAR